MAIDVSVISAIYQHSDKRPYLELHYRIFGNTLKTETSEGKYSSSVRILMTLETNKEIRQFDHYRLNTDINTLNEDIIDIRRYQVEEGKYLLKIEVTDILDSTSVFYFSDSVHVFSAGGDPTIGSILLLSEVESLSAGQAEVDARVKYQLLLKALPYQFAYKNVGSIYYYTEVYNMSAETDDGVYYIKTVLRENKTWMRESEIVFSDMRKRKIKETDIYINTLNVEDIPSGNYILELIAELADGRKLASSKVFFQRSNPDFDQKLLLSAAPVIEDIGEVNKFEALSSDTLVYSLKAISPLVRQVDSELIKLLISKRDKKAMSLYLSNYFYEEYPKAPFKAYEQFMVIARFTDQYYNNGFRHGFETDRGRIFIKYGRPSDIVTVEDEVSAPPYEIWVYNELMQNNQTNVKFLFYNPDLMHNGHILLHSTARGEINNVQWQSILYKNAPGEGQRQANFFEGQSAQDAINRRAVRYFNDL